jgi:hypothetical protein
VRAARTLPDANRAARISRVRLFADGFFLKVPNYVRMARAKNRMLSVRGPLFPIFDDFFIYLTEIRRMTG